MEQVKCADLRGVYEKKDYQEKAYFQSETHINLESTGVKKTLVKMIQAIFAKIDKYQMKGLVFQRCS